jgi:hypothetical protein
MTRVWIVTVSTYDEATIPVLAFPSLEAAEKWKADAPKIRTLPAMMGFPERSFKIHYSIVPVDFMVGAAEA